MTALTCIAVIAVPLGLGALIGAAVARIRGRRVRGAAGFLACVLLPAAAVVGFMIRFPVLGPWDALFEGLVLGAGVALSAHRSLENRTRALFVAGSLILSLLLLEILTRWILPPPPGFPSQGKPRLLLSSVLRGGEARQPWDTLCKDIVCSILHGDRYPPLFDQTHSLRTISTPQNTPKGDGTRRRVLHLGDSMAYGFGLDRAATFTAELERLEPDTEHINASIPGTAPDAYFAVMQAWVASHEIDQVVMHVYEGNDLDGLDSRYPCSGWQSLLVYERERVSPRTPHPTPPDLGRAGWKWLRYHNPPPYLIRVLVGTSSAAAYLAAAMALEPYFLVDQPLDVRIAHLESILRTARQTLSDRGISFVVSVVPARTWLETLDTWQHHAPLIVEAAGRAGAAVIDGSAAFREAVLQGQHLFFEHPSDIHFGAPGHALMARWLHEELPGP